jgi:hypothetical protein
MKIKIPHLFHKYQEFHVRPAEYVDPKGNAVKSKKKIMSFIVDEVCIVCGHINQREIRLDEAKRRIDGKQK